MRIDSRIGGLSAWLIGSPLALVLKRKPDTLVFSHNRLHLDRRIQDVAFACSAFQVTAQSGKGQRAIRRTARFERVRCHKEGLPVALRRSYSHRIEKLERALVEFADQTAYKLWIVVQ